MENKNLPTIIMQSPSKQNGIVDYAFKALFAVGLFFGGRYAWRKYQENKQNDKAGGDPNIQAAFTIHSAIDGGGTSEKVLYEVANSITDWEEVSKAYRKEYHTNMLDDIKNDLEPDEFQKFMNVYNLGQKNPDGSPKASKNVIAAGLLVITEKEAYLRKTPVYQKVLPNVLKQLDILSMNRTNVVGLIKPGMLVGISTGKYSDDIKSPSGTRFLEVQVIVMDDKLKHSLVKMWIASSQVKTVTNKLVDWKKEYPVNKTVIIRKNVYNAALSGIVNQVAQDNIKVITKTNLVGVYDENFRLIDFARKENLILGHKISDQKLGESDMICYQTIDGKIRNSFATQVTEITELS